MALHDNSALGHHRTSRSSVIGRTDPTGSPHPSALAETRQLQPELSIAWVEKGPLIPHDTRRRKPSGRTTKHPAPSHPSRLLRAHTPQAARPAHQSAVLAIFAVFTEPMFKGVAMFIHSPPLVRIVNNLNQCLPNRCCAQKEGKREEAWGF
jgi:hypothetical protein